MQDNEPGPNYDVEIDADELLADLAEAAAEYGEDHERYRRWWHESLQTPSEHIESRYWMMEELGGRRATAKAILTIQQGDHDYTVGKYRNEDGTVDVRGFMRFVSRRADHAHEDAHGDYTETRQASEAESALSSILTTLRDDYGVGWPRLDDVSGTPLECDLP